MIARGLAVFLAGFTLLGLIGEVRGASTDIGLWFVDLRDVDRGVRAMIFALLGLSLLAWAVAREPGRRRRRVATVACLAFAAIALRDALRFGDAVASGLVRPALPIPLSLPIALVLAALAVAIWRDRRGVAAGTRRVRLAVVTVAAAVALAFPVLQIGFFGTTDYRRPADAAVVFGARVYASGEPSPLLADRIAAGVALYRAGLVPILIMSGGDGADGRNEALVMRDRTIAAGVDAAAIVVDETGVTTEATVDHAMALVAARSSGPARLIAVSQAYHLPR
ncbi:MAG: hypothetical protein QOF49_1436, partial [Chloroflexota bacterium]|nr:hypothetical protein [Chloroflexota bacterium]